MKKTTIAFAMLFMLAATFFSFTIYEKSKRKLTEGDRVSFRIKGTGHKGIFVTIGIGYQPGSGACCTGVSENSTVSFVGEVGDVVYDGKTRRIITKIYKDLEGTTINLADYY